MTFNSMNFNFIVARGGTDLLSVLAEEGTKAARSAEIPQERDTTRAKDKAGHEILSFSELLRQS